MFALKKILSSSGAYHGSMTTKTGETPTNVLSQMITTIRFSSSRIKRRRRSLPVKLAYQKYQIANKVDLTIPIIICHGLLGAKSNWSYIARELFESTNNRKVLAVDARNHGDSPHTAEFSYEHMICDLLHFLKEQDIKKASFIGHGLGGRICMLISLLFPQLLESLVVVDITPTKLSPNMLALPKILNIISGLKLDSEDSLREARRRAADELKKQIEDYQLIHFLLTNLIQKKSQQEWHWKFNVKSISKNMTSVCRLPVPSTKFHGRTLFVAGAQSDCVRPEDEPKIKSIFTEAEFAYIEGAGHWVHADKPKEFLQVVTDFLKKDAHHYTI